MLRRRRRLGSHLELANLALGKAAIVVIARTLLLRFRLRELLLLGLVCLVTQRGPWFGVLAAEVDTGGCWWNFALVFKKTGLKIDDVIA
jgi:hypothetical protein